MQNVENSENYENNSKAIKRLSSRIKKLYLTVVPLAIIFAVCSVIFVPTAKDSSYFIPLTATLLSLCCASTIIFIGLKTTFILKFKKQFKTDNKKALKKFLWKASLSKFMISSSWCEKLMQEA